MMKLKPILIIEDDEGVRDALRMALELEGFEVSVAVNGEEGLSQLEANQDFGLILLDLMMPVMDGWEFLASFRLQRISKTVPVLVMSALDELKHRPEGVVGFLGKPIPLDTIIDLANRYCGSRAQAAIPCS